MDVVMCVGKLRMGKKKKEKPKAFRRILFLTPTVLEKKKKGSGRPGYCRAGEKGEKRIERSLKEYE